MGSEGARDLPNQGDLMAGRAQALGRQGDIKQTQEALCDAALRQEGQSAYRWIDRGEILICLREQTDRHCFHKAVQADPDWLVPLEIALLYLEHKIPSQALVAPARPFEQVARQLLLLVRAGLVRARAAPGPPGRTQPETMPGVLSQTPGREPSPGRHGEPGMVIETNLERALSKLA